MARSKNTMTKQEKRDRDFDKRMAKAGYEKTGSGKGDCPRPVNKSVYDQNYERIFGHK